MLANAHGRALQTWAPLTPCSILPVSHCTSHCSIPRTQQEATKIVRAWGFHDSHTSKITGACLRSIYIRGWLHLASHTSNRCEPQAGLELAPSRAGDWLRCPCLECQRPMRTHRHVSALLQSFPRGGGRPLARNQEALCHGASANACSEHACCNWLTRKCQHRQGKHPSSVTAWSGNCQMYLTACCRTRHDPRPEMGRFT